MREPSHLVHICDITAVGSDITRKVTMDACSASCINSVRSWMVYVNLCHICPPSTLDKVVTEECFVL
jgi:hypothetical protein